MSKNFIKQFLPKRLLPRLLLIFLIPLIIIQCSVIFFFYDRHWEKIVNRFFSENEKSYLNKLTPNEYSIETLKLWVSKEAAIKWDRGSLYKDITCWECDTESKNIINKKTKNKLNLSSFQLQNWYLSVASKEKYRSSDLTVCFY